MGSRTLAELIALQALSRRFLDTSEGRRAVDMIQNILQDSNRVDIFKLACQAMIDMDLRPLLPKIIALRRGTRRRTNLSASIRIVSRAIPCLCTTIHYLRS